MIHTSIRPGRYLVEEETLNKKQLQTTFQDAKVIIVYVYL